MLAWTTVVALLDLITDGTIDKILSSRCGSDPFQVSDAETMLHHIQPREQPARSAFMFARHGCPHCDRAKALLKERGIAFEAVHLGEELTMQGVRAASGTATVPQVFIGGKFIGNGEQLSQFIEMH